MTRIAAMETSSAQSSVALLDTDTGALTIRTHEAPRGHVEFCLPALLELLAGAPLAGVDAFAVGIGPGAFTGLRVGVQTAKTLAHTLGKPLIPVSSLEALAAAATEPGTVLACMHAFRGEVFIARFDTDGAGDVLRRSDDECATPDEAAELARAHHARILGTGPDAFPEQLGPPPEIRFPSAAAVARIAAARPREATDALALEPRYLRRSEAEIRWGETGVVAKRPDRIRFRTPSP